MAQETGQEGDTVAGTSLSDVPDTSAFAKKNTAFLFELGPSGDRLSMVSREWKRVCPDDKDSCPDDKRRYVAHDTVLIVDTEAMQVVDRLDIGDTISVNWMDWADDQTLLLSISTGWKFDGGKIFYPVSRILSVRLDRSRDVVALFQDEYRMLRDNARMNRIVDLLRNDPEHVLIGAYRRGDHDLFRANVQTGGVERVAKGRKFTIAWFTDRDGNPSMRFDCNNRKCQKIRVLKPEDGGDPNDPDTDWDRVMTFEVDQERGDDTFEFQPVAPGENDNEYIVVAKDETTGRRSIRIFNLETETFGKTIASDPEYDVAHALIDTNSGQYAGYAVWRDRKHFVIEDAQSQAEIDRLSRHFGEYMNVSITNYSHDGKKAVLYVFGPGKPGLYYLYNFESRELDILLSRASSLPDRLQTQTETLRIPARDGTLLSAYLTHPTARDGGPLIALVHGGPEVRDRLDFDSDVEFLASRGYRVLRVNFRGSSGYGEAFTEAGYGEWGGLMNDDVVDAVRFVQARDDLDGSQTCIMGHSYGGYAALYSGAAHPELFSCIIAGAAPTDLPAILKDERKKHGRNSETLAYWETSIGDRRDDRDKLETKSPVNMASHYDDPILLIHGEDDNVVSLDQAKRMRKALDKHDKSYVYLELENTGHYHSYWRIEKRQLYFESLQSFLEAHMPVDP